MKVNLVYLALCYLLLVVNVYSIRQTTEKSIRPDLLEFIFDGLPLCSEIEQRKHTECIMEFAIIH